MTGSNNKATAFSDEAPFAAVGTVGAAGSNNKATAFSDEAPYMAAVVIFPSEYAEGAEA